MLGAVKNARVNENIEPIELTLREPSERGALFIQRLNALEGFTKDTPAFSGPNCIGVVLYLLGVINTVRYVDPMAELDPVIQHARVIETKNINHLSPGTVLCRWRVHENKCEIYHMAVVVNHHGGIYEKMGPHAAGEYRFSSIEQFIQDGNRESPSALHIVDNFEQCDVQQRFLTALNFDGIQLDNTDLQLEEQFLKVGSNKHDAEILLKFYDDYLQDPICINSTKRYSLMKQLYLLLDDIHTEMIDVLQAAKHYSGKEKITYLKQHAGNQRLQTSISILRDKVSAELIQYHRQHLTRHTPAEQTNGPVVPFVAVS